MDFDEFNHADDILLDEQPKFKPLDYSWAWLAKYRVPYRPSPEGFDGIYYHNLTHTGLYSPTGAGKTWLRNTILEVSLWAHDTNIIISDRKLDSLGFLLPQDPAMMLNRQFFPNPRTGNFPILPDCVPRDRFHLWLPATHFSFIDPLVRELMEWGVVKFFRFHPRTFIETTLGDHIPRAVGMTAIESLATARALMQTRGKLRSEQEKEYWSLEDLEEEIKTQEQLTPASKPYQKLMILQDSGIISKDTSVELIDKVSGDHLQEKVHVFKNFYDIITKPASQPYKDPTSHVHVFCNKYMSSPTADNTLSTCINYILFSAIKEACETIHKKRRVLCHLPEAEYSLSSRSAESQNDRIRAYFASSYGDALRETRQWQLYHFLDTQQVTELPSNITANQMTLWLLPGFKHKAELLWLQAGVGRAHLTKLGLMDLFSMKNPFDSRGFAFYIGADKAVKVWTRPRQTLHFKEGNDPVELLKNYRLNFGLDNARPWRRWDSD